MTTLTEEKALAILASNLKRKKRTVDMLTIAESCRYLKELYGSWMEVARKADVSYEMIREFSAILKLPPSVQQLVRARAIDRVEIADELSKIAGADRQIKAAEIFASQKLTTKDVRDVVQYAKTNPDLSIEECVNRVLESKPIIEKRYVVVMELQNYTLQTLDEESQKLTTSPQNLSKTIIEDALKLKNMMSFDMHGRVIAVTVGAEGFKTLKTETKKLRVNLENLADRIIQNWLAKSARQVVE